MKEEKIYFSLRRTRERKKSDLEDDVKRKRILFCNTAGLARLDEEDWEHIKRFDIIGLTETRSREKEEKSIKVD